MEKSVENQRPKTLGEHLVRTDFNVSGDSGVDKIKRKADELIDLIHEVGDDSRLSEYAIKDIESGAMWAVKAATAKRTEVQFGQYVQSQSPVQPSGQ